MRENLNSSILYMIVTFSLAIIIIWKRENLPAKLKRPLAFLTLIMVSAAFILFLVSLYRMD